MGTGQGNFLHEEAGEYIRPNVIKYTHIGSIVYKEQRKTMQ